MRIRLSSSHGDESGFTLAEMAVGLAVAMLVLVSTMTFLSNSVRIIHRLNTARDIRDQGLMAVETIEREFRKVLEYGGSFDIESDVLTAGFGGRNVRIEKVGDDIAGYDIVLTSGGQTTVFGGTGKCTRFEITALVDDEYVPGSDGTAGQARMIVIEFDLEDESFGIKRSFKAAFSSVNATGS